MMQDRSLWPSVAASFPRDVSISSSRTRSVSSLRWRSYPLTRPPLGFILARTRGTPEGSDYAPVAPPIHACLHIAYSYLTGRMPPGKLDEAEPLYRKAVEIGDAVLGPQHPDLATWLNNLATLVRDRGDPEAAEPLQRRAVAIGERVLGPSHPDLGAQVINLASLLSMQGRWSFEGSCGRADQRSIRARLLE